MLCATLTRQAFNVPPWWLRRVVFANQVCYSSIEFPEELEPAKSNVVQNKIYHLKPEEMITKISKEKGVQMKFPRNSGKILPGFSFETSVEDFKKCSDTPGVLPELPTPGGHKISLTLERQAISGPYLNPWGYNINDCTFMHQGRVFTGPLPLDLRIMHVGGDDLLKGRWSVLVGYNQQTVVYKGENSFLTSAEVYVPEPIKISSYDGVNGRAIIDLFDQKWWTPMDFREYLELTC